MTETTTPTPAAAVQSEFSSVLTTVWTWVKAHSTSVGIFVCGFVAGFLLH